MLTGEWLPKRIANLVRDVPYDAEETFHGETGVRRQETVERDQRAGVSVQVSGSKREKAGQKTAAFAKATARQGGQKSDDRGQTTEIFMWERLSQTCLSRA